MTSFIVTSPPTTTGSFPEVPIDTTCSVAIAIGYTDTEHTFALDQTLVRLIDTTTQFALVGSSHDLLTHNTYRFTK